MAEYNEVPDVVFICVKYYSLAEAVVIFEPIVMERIRSIIRF